MPKFKKNITLNFVKFCVFIDMIRNYFKFNVIE